MINDVFPGKTCKKWVIMSLLAIMALGAPGCQPGYQGHQSNPEAIALNERGINFYDEGAYDKAILNFDKALSLDTDNPDVYLNCLYNKEVY